MDESYRRSPEYQLKRMANAISDAADDVAAIKKELTL